MKFKKFSLKAGKKELIKNLNINFNSGKINHILGDNGVGKSTFAKACFGIHPYKGEIKISNEKVLIGSYTNVPTDFNIEDLIIFLSKFFAKKNIEKLYNLLTLEKIDKHLKIKNMSDGQKQKIKIFSFLSSNPKTIILDEFTASLDKKSCNELYTFMNKYIQNENITIINITHNLGDLKNMEGAYYSFEDKTIKKIDSREELINIYLGSES